MKNTDIKLSVSRCLNGDKESYSPVVRHFQQRIYDLCFHYLGTLQDAEDAAAEIFIKAYRALGSFNPRYAFSTWLYRIASNHCIGILRRQKREKEYLLEQGSNPSKLKHSAAPDTVFFEDTKKTAFRNALETLPIQYRTALMLKYHQDLSYKEIAETMDLPVNTVGSLILRGKKDLKEKIRDQEKEAS
ncbi:MAG: RNA polymerase sigma factor [bacterium]|nr:RNA polymerase sigma factor [bacterium]